MAHLSNWRFRQRLTYLIVAFTILVGTSGVRAEIFFGPILNPDSSNGGFFGTDLYSWGSFNIDDSARVDNNNDVVRISTGFQQPNSHGAGMSIHISNGENGNNGDDPASPDTFNFIPADAGFGAIGNPDGRLANGNSVRFSFWMRQDPNDLVQAIPSTEPVVKLEFWTEALANGADPAVNENPTRADRIFDTQLQSAGAGFVDLNGDGAVNNQAGGGGETFSLNAEWTLVSTTYTLDDSGWGYDYSDGFVPKSILDVEEVRATMFWSEFENNDLTDGGSVLIDQPMLEIYRTENDMPSLIPNPHPDINVADPDFDNDGNLDCTDIDQLVMEISVGSDNQAFDLTGEGEVDMLDLNSWLQQAGAVNNDSGNAYRQGDANLDGVVDVSDFNRWNSNKFTNTPAWCSGDFTADGVVDVSDFNVWNANKFQTSDHVGTVPEPDGVWLLLVGLLGFARRIRR